MAKRKTKPQGEKPTTKIATRGSKQKRRTSKRIQAIKDTPKYTFQDITESDADDDNEVEGAPQQQKRRTSKRIQAVKKTPKQAVPDAVEGDADDDSDDDSDDECEPQPPNFKDDSNAFNGIVVEGEDHISKIPSELLDKILSYCVRDHHGDIGERMKASRDGIEFKTKSAHYALLSLACMSKHVKDHVESFCERQLRSQPNLYKDFAQDERKRVDRESGSRRSARIEKIALPKSPVYRSIFVTTARILCIRCNDWTGHSAPAADALGVCPCCEEDEFGASLSLSDAKSQYDLKDYMLLKSRIPGPRAKHLDLPVIPYTSVYGGLGWYLGAGIKYKFLKADVERIAKRVHGDVGKHMSAVRRQRAERRERKRDKAKQNMKIRYHSENLKKAKPELKKYYQDRIDFYAHDDYAGESYTLTLRARERRESRCSCGEHEYSDSDLDDYDLGFSDGYGSDASGYGNYDDIHNRIHCDPEWCDCWIEKRMYQAEANYVKRRNAAAEATEAAEADEN